MKTLALKQGTPQWLAHRAKSHNASDAPAVMGKSPYKTRSALIHERATGITPTIDAATQARFDRGHRVEVPGRAMAEVLLGDDLYPIVGESDDGYLSASFDGVSLDGTKAFECKLWNEAKAEDVRKGHVPDVDWWQVVQQAVVSGASSLLYMVTDGTEERTVYVEVLGEQARKCAGALLTAWQQFDADVAAYEPPQITEPPPVGAHIDSLPALRVEVEGKVLATNLDQFRANAMQILGSINRDLKTDQDFADAEQAVKDCKVMEDRLDAAKANVLAQMQSVDEVCRTIDNVSAETRKVRLELDRLVKSEKEHRRAEIVQHYIDQVRAHYASINATLGEHSLPVPASVTATIGNAIKGRKTLGSITDAADAACATAKIAASQQAERVRQNIVVLDEFKEHAHLFADRVTLCASKAPEDLRNLATARIAEHAKREAERMEAERQRIRAEEAAKLERQQAAQEAAQRAPEKTPSVIPPATRAESANPLVKRSNATVKLGDICASIAPLSISAAGLAQMGFQQVPSKGWAKLYAADDLPAMRQAMIDVISAAHEQRRAG